MAKNLKTKVITGIVRLSYPHIWEPDSFNGSEPKYTAAFIIPKSDKQTVKEIEAAIDAAIEEGVTKKYGGVRPDKNSKSFWNPLRDGDTERNDEAYANAFFVNAKSKSAPQVVDRNVKPILERDEVYSGCYVRASLTFYPYASNGSKGVACSLGNIQKVRDGEPLGSRSNAEDDFTALDGDSDTSFLA